MGTISREAALSNCVCLPSKKRSTLKKEFAPNGSKFLPFRVDHFLEGDWYAGKQLGSHISCFPCTNDRTSTMCIEYPLRNNP